MISLLTTGVPETDVEKFREEHAKNHVLLMRKTGAQTTNMLIDSMPRQMLSFAQTMRHFGVQLILMKFKLHIHKNYPIYKE